jgi:hypothetical protein
MNIVVSDDVLQEPNIYVDDILSNEFVDIYDGVNVFQNIQPRDHSDEFTAMVLDFIGPTYEVVWNFIRKSPKGQDEPNFVHTDEMMGDITAILYLSRQHPDEDGTTIYSEDGNPSVVVYAKFNRMVIFDSKLPHSRNIFENFGQGESSRLIQVAFLKEKDERH